jgi:hypothetical protein
MRSHFVVAVLLLAACGDDGATPRPDAPVSSGTAPDVASLALPDLIAGTPATATMFSVVAGDAPITWSVSAGTLPGGMALNANGSYAGTPTQVGTFMFTVTATNAFGSDAVELTQAVLAPAANATVLLANNRIAAFPTSAPYLSSAEQALSGITAGEVLVAIDRRPVNGQLYGVAINSGSTTFTLYAIHPSSSSAVAVGAPQSFATNNADTVFGLDVNPVVDRLRVVSGTGMNFRINPNTGIVIDGDANGGSGNQRDTNLNGAANAATETAYSNNVINNGGTTKHYTVNDGTLYEQNPSNGGVLATVAAIAGIAKVYGFDITPSTAYVVASATGQTAQQGGTLDLATGAFTSSGTFPVTDIRGLAASLGERTVVALSSDGTTLLRFRESTANSVGVVTLTGITAGEALVGLDFRPSTAQLFTLGVNATANTATLYLVDPLTGALTAVSTSGIVLVESGGTPTDLPDPATARYAFDFNPTVDRIRVMTSTGVNFRINPVTGTAVDSDVNAAGTNPDTPLSGTVSALDNAAYTNGHPGTGAAVTALYGISGTTNSLYLVTNPNAGTIGTATPITSNGNALDFSATAAFDIPWSTSTTANNTAVTAGVGYAVVTVGTATLLYRIDLVSGVATFIGNVGPGNVPMIDIAVGQ